MGKSGRKQRLDTLLVDRELAPSRERARALILAGKVVVNGHAATKAGVTVATDAEIRLKEPDHPYVSRGGLKLKKALEVFDVDPRGSVALDIGASSGGFTDVLLKSGATRVFAIDVGYGQLDWKLRKDSRVVVLERENFRHLDPSKIAEPADLAVIDVSFISLTKILGKAAEILGPGKPIICLIKPQFEVGRASIGKGGVVRDVAARARAVEGIHDWATQRGFVIEGNDESPITGPAGNVEYLMHLTTPPAAVGSPAE